MFHCISVNTLQILPFGFYARKLTTLFLRASPAHMNANATTRLKRAGQETRTCACEPSLSSNCWCKCGVSVILSL